MDKCLYFNKDGTYFEDGTTASVVFSRLIGDKHYVGAFSAYGIRFCFEVNQNELEEIQSKGHWVGVNEQ